MKFIPSYSVNHTVALQWRNFNC